MEQVRPVLVVGLHPACKGLYPILPVPLGQMLQEVVHRIVEHDIVGIDIAHDIFIPTFNALRQSPDSDGVTRLSCQILKRESMTRPQTVFRHAPHHVLAEFVVAVQEDVDLHHQQCLRRDVLRGTHLILLFIVLLLMLLPIGILEDLRHHIGIFAVCEAHQRLPFGEGHVESRLTTVFRQTGDDQCVAHFAIIIDEERHIIISLREVVLIDETLCLITVAPWHNLIWQHLLWLDGLEGLLQIGGVGIERLCHRIII